MMGITFSTIITELEKEPFLSDFKFKKSTSSFYKIINGGWKRIELDHWTEWGCISVRPQFDVRFDIASKWFEKFSYKKISVQRDYSVVGCAPSMLDLGYGRLDSIVCFDKNGDDFNQKYQYLVDLLTRCSNSFFNKYNTIQDVYYDKILPIIEGKKEMQDSGGIEWAFEYLTICKVVSPENYDKLKKLIREYINYRMYNPNLPTPDPNIAPYYNQLDEMFSYLESQTIDDLMNKKHHK